jgi:hypothetical protein
MAGTDVEGDDAADEVLGVGEVLRSGEALAAGEVLGAGEALGTGEGLASRPVAGVVFAADRLPAVCVAPDGAVMASALPVLIPEMRATAAARRNAMGVHRQPRSSAPQRLVAGRLLLDRTRPRTTVLSTARSVRGRLFYEPVKTDTGQIPSFP